MSISWRDDRRRSSSLLIGKMRILVISDQNKAKRVYDSMKNLAKTLEIDYITKIIRYYRLRESFSIPFVLTYQLLANLAWCHDLYLSTRYS